MKEISEWEGLKKNKLTGYVQHFTLFNQCWFIRMLVIVARCPRKLSEDLMTSQMSFMSFICLHTFKVQFFSKNSLWSNILNLLQTKVTPMNSHFFIFSV